MWFSTGRDNTPTHARNIDTPSLMPPLLFMLVCIVSCCVHSPLSRCQGGCQRLDLCAIASGEGWWGSLSCCGTSFQLIGSGVSFRHRPNPNCFFGSFFCVFLCVLPCRILQRFLLTLESIRWRNLESPCNAHTATFWTWVASPPPANLLTRLCFYRC